MTSIQNRLVVLSVLLVGLLGSSIESRAQPPPPPFFQSLAWSPDGKKIVFCAVMESWEEGYSIYVVNADGTGLRRLTEPGFRALYPTWSPDGSRIAFGGKRNGDSEIFIIGEDGSNLRQITDNEIDDAGPSWSPDGSSMTFYSKPEDTYEIFTMQVDGSKRRRLTKNRFDDWNPMWSPDGNTIVFYSVRKGDASDEILIISADGSDERATGVEGVFPTWSPDGEEIVFGGTRDGTRGVFSVSVEGEGERLLARSGFYGALSPDGSQLAVITQSEDPKGKKHTIIEIRDRQGSNPKKIVY